jgi:hypothetical protein
MCAARKSASILLMLNVLSAFWSVVCRACRRTVQDQQPNRMHEEGD